MCKMCKTERSRHDAAPSLNSTWLILSRTDQIPSPDDLGRRSALQRVSRRFPHRDVAHVDRNIMDRLRNVGNRSGEFYVCKLIVSTYTGQIVTINT